METFNLFLNTLHVLFNPYDTPFVDEEIVLQKFGNLLIRLCN
jgi:hypothetical protein